MKRDFNLEFKDLIKNTLAKSLKEIGFKKSNLNFMRSTDNFVQTCNVQKSLYNSIDSIKFTINYGFFVPVVHSVIKKTTDLPIFPKTYDCCIADRMGFGIYGRDYWYEINENITLELLTKQFKNDIENYLISMFQKIQTMSSLLKFVRINCSEGKIVVNNIVAAVLEFEFGDYERGKELLISEYNDAVIPKLTEGKIVYPDGSEEITYSEFRLNEYYIEFCKQIAEKYKVNFLIKE